MASDLMPNRPPVLGGLLRPARIVCIDDERWFGELVELLIQRQFRAVMILTFQNRDTAWQELQRADPDLLITDMNNDNVPGRVEYMGMSGWELLPLLAKKGVKYPVLVVSGSFSQPGVESRARALAGPGLNVSFMTKPFATEFFERELIRLLSCGGNSGRRVPTGRL